MQIASHTVTLSLTSNSCGVRVQEDKDALHTVKTLSRNGGRNDKFYMRIVSQVRLRQRNSFRGKKTKNDSLQLYQFIACIGSDIRPLNKTLFLHKGAYGRADK